jgi:hypothetical protein
MFLKNKFAGIFTKSLKTLENNVREEMTSFLGVSGSF